jgi:hypothetical protein
MRQRELSRIAAATSAALDSGALEQPHVRMAHNAPRTGHRYASAFARSMPARIRSAASPASAQRSTLAHLPFSRSL